MGHSSAQIPLGRPTLLQGPEEWGGVHLGWTLHLSGLFLGLTSLLPASFPQTYSCVLLSRKSYPRSLLGELGPSCNGKLPFFPGTQPHRRSVLYTMQRNFFMNTQEEADLFMGASFSPLSLRNHSALDLPFWVHLPVVLYKSL